MQATLICANALLFLSASAAFAQTTYTFLSFDPPGSLETHATGINDAGDIVGYYIAASGIPNGYIRTSAGVFATGILLGHGPTYLSGINNQNVVTAFYFPPGLNETSGEIVNNVFTPYTFPGSSSTQINGINNDGEFTGTFVDSSRMVSGFLHYPLFDRPFSVDGAAATLAEGIDNIGVVTGSWTPTIPYSVFHGFLRLINGVIETYNQPGAINTHFHHINDCGVIAGEFTTPDNINHGLLGKFNEFLTIDVPGSGGTVIMDINNYGLIIGEYLDPSGSIHGFIGRPNAPTCRP